MGGSHRENALGVLGSLMSILFLALDSDALLYQNCLLLNFFERQKQKGRRGVWLWLWALGRVFSGVGAGVLGILSAATIPGLTFRARRKKRWHQFQDP